MACNASELLEEGKCYQCLNEKQMAIVELQLLCSILEAFGGGGGGGGGGLGLVYHGTGSPEGVQVSIGGSGIYYDETGAQWDFYGVSGGNTGWVKVL